MPATSRPSPSTTESSNKSVESQFVPHDHSGPSQASLETKTFFPHEHSEPLDANKKRRKSPLERKHRHVQNIDETVSV